MSPQSFRRDSFLVRIWRVSTAFDADDPGMWRAYVQHVQSGESRYVDDLDSLLAFFEQWTGVLQDQSSSSSKTQLKLTGGERTHET